jgi:RNA polymerase sigma-70 factor, ECF subfamily
MVTCDAIMSSPKLASPFAPIVVHATQVWSDFGTDRAQFAEHLARLGIETSAHAGDLYLAFACARRDDLALAEFDRRLAPAIRGTLRSLKLSTDETDDLAQEVIIRLTLGAEGKDPALLKYRGEGALEAWVSQVARRAAVDLWRKQASSPEHAGVRSIDRLSEVLVTDAEADALFCRLDEVRRKLVRDAFQRFTREAIAALEPQPRNLMTMHLVDRVPLRALCSIAGVTDQSSVSRQLKKLRQGIKDEIRRRMNSELATTDSEFSSVVESMLSHFPEQVEQ